MKYLITIIVLSLPSCATYQPGGTYTVDGKPTWMTHADARARTAARGKAMRLAEEREVSASGRPLTIQERAAVASKAVASTRDPQSTEIQLRAFSYVMNGHRRVDFFMKGINAFGGPTGWVLYHARLRDDGTILILKGGLSEAYAKQVTDAME